MMLFSTLGSGNAVASRIGYRSYGAARVILRFVLFVVCLIPLAACSQYLEERSIKRAVIKYNEALSLTYKDLNEAHVAPLASSGQLTKIKRVMHPLMLKNSRMITVLESIEIGDISREDDKVLVETDERWEYWFEDRATDKMEGGREKIHYGNTYTLVRKDEQWIVDNIQTIVK